MIRWLKSIWFQVNFLDLDFDLEDALCVDVLCLSMGGDGLRFRGSLFMLYYAPGISERGNWPHFTCDLFYLRQFIDPED